MARTRGWARRRGVKFAWARCALAIGLVGCMGGVSSPTSGPDGPGPGNGPGGTPTTPGGRPEVVCDPSTPPPTVAWLRLSRAQVTATVEHLVGDSVSGLERLLAAVPLDITAYPTVASPLSIEHITAYGNVAAAVGDLVVLEPAVRDRYITCDVSTMDDVCARAFLRSFSEAAERIPLADAVTETRLTLLRSEAEPEDGVRLVVRTVLQSPRFLYRMEEGDPSRRDGSLRALTSREVANRLADGFLGEPPDRALVGGALDSRDARSQAATDLMADPRTQAHFREFVSTWLGLDQLPLPGYSDAFLAGLDLAPQGDQPTFERVASEEVLALAEHVVFDQRGTLRELLTTRLGLPSDPRLAEVYGVPSSNDWVELPEERAGILTRVGALYSGEDNEHPILRGVHLRDRILCDELPPPPPNALDEVLDALPPRGEVSTREWFDLITEPATCMGCHVAINPLGHAFGAFDGLGRYATEDQVFEQGELIATHPVDTNVVPTLPSQAGVSVMGGAGLGVALADDPQARECFASQLFHFTMGRAAEVGDGCVLAEMAEALRTGSIIDAWLALAAHDHFAQSTAGDDR